MVSFRSCAQFATDLEARGALKPAAEPLVQTIRAHSIIADNIQIAAHELGLHWDMFRYFDIICHYLILFILWSLYGHVLSLSCHYLILFIILSSSGHYLIMFIIWSLSCRFSFFIIIHLVARLSLFDYLNYFIMCMILSFLFIFIILLLALFCHDLNMFIIWSLSCHCFVIT